MISIIDKIAMDLCLDKEYLANIVDRADYYYKDYSIPKFPRGTRHIAQASPELKTLQYWVMHNILNRLPVSKGAFAYKTGDSIKRHASFHKNSKFIFHTDIQNFFPNIHPNMLSTILIQYPIWITELDLNAAEALQAISDICFRNNKLCIGTVSSPCISNIILNKFDEELIEYCNAKNYKYSRYADDIYISSDKYIPKEVISFVACSLKKRGFNLNASKTWFVHQDIAEE